MKGMLKKLDFIGFFIAFKCLFGVERKSRDCKVNTKHRFLQIIIVLVVLSNMFFKFGIDKDFN